MIEFAKILGEVENHSYRVKFRTGETLLVPIMVGSGIVAPSKEWVKDYKDDFLAVVAFEKDILENPIIIGFFPTNSAKSKKYDVVEQILECLTELLEQLGKAKVNTNIGPQPFMPDSIKKFSDITTKLKDINKLINKVGDAE